MPLSILTLKSNNTKAQLKEMTKNLVPNVFRKLSIFSKKK